MPERAFRTDAARAEQLSLARTILFYLMAAALMVATLLGLHNHPRGGPLVMWGVMAALMAFNLSPYAPLRGRRGRVGALMNDDSTREHRRSALAAGFWAAAVALAVAAAWLPIGASETAQLIVTVALFVALVIFAALERRALGDG